MAGGRGYAGHRQQASDDCFAEAQTDTDTVICIRVGKTSIRNI